MKWLKKIIITNIFLILVPILVQAKSISFDSPKPISDNKYTVAVTIDNMNINYLKGYLSVTNGTITNVTMANGWINKTGNNNSFYFYHNGVDNSSSLIATFEITITGNSVYTATNLNYGTYSCQKDDYNNYFDPSGNLLDATSFINICEKGQDATLKSLKPSVGALTPTFSKDKYSYNLYVDEFTNQVIFDAVPSNNDSKIISGTKCILKNNVTSCSIVVESSTGKRVTYNVCVHKAFSSEFSISDFKVVNGTLDKNFNENETSYKLLPNKDASYIYFTFKLNGINHTSDKCSSDSSTCSLTVSSNGVKKRYVFYLDNQNNFTDNSSNIIIGNNNLLIKDEIVSNNKTNNSEQKSKNENTDKNNISNSLDSENKKNEIINPDEDNSDPAFEEKKDNNSENIEKEDNRNVILIIICFINLILGVFLGIFIKSKHKNNI